MEVGEPGPATENVLSFVALADEREGHADATTQPHRITARNAKVATLNTWSVIEAEYLVSVSLGLLNI